MVTVTITAYVQQVEASVSLPGTAEDYSETSTAGIARREQFKQGLASTLGVGAEAIQITGISRRRRLQSASGLLDIDYTVMNEDAAVDVSTTFAGK